MDCDEVFTVLTRAPFPTGSSKTDWPVQRHLARCQACQQLAEALRPAPELFHEALTPVQARRLPGYYVEATQPEIALVEITAGNARNGQQARPTVTAPARRTNARTHASAEQGVVDPIVVVASVSPRAMSDNLLGVMIGIVITFLVCGLGWAFM